MLAIQQQGFGDPASCRQSVARPELGIRQILVHIQAASMYPTDWKNRAGKAVVRNLPLVLGWDVFGVVEAVGLVVTLFHPGDDV